MNYLKTFIENCQAYLKSQSVDVSNSPTKSQRKVEYERKLKRKYRNLKAELSRQADNWGDLAYEKGNADISKLRTDMLNEIRTILRDWEDEQKEKSGLYD